MARASDVSIPEPDAPSVRPSGLPQITPEGGTGTGMKTHKSRNRKNRQRRAKIAISKASHAPPHNEPSKRTRPDDTMSPRGAHKKQKLDSTRRSTPSYAEVAQSNLQVAVVRADNQQSTEEQATLVKRYLERRILEDIKDPSIDFSPRFQGRPIITEGALKLWCEDEPSLEWLTAAIEQLPTTSCPRLKVILQSELSRKVRAALFIPECTNNLEDTSLVLASQNRWAEVNTWTVYNHTLQENDILFVAVGIPEGLVPEVMRRGRRLAHNLGNVYVRFYGTDGSLQDSPPTVAPTATVAQQAVQHEAGTSAAEAPAVGPSTTTPAAPPHSSPKPSGSNLMEEMCVELQGLLETDSSDEEKGSQDVGDPDSLL